MPRLLNKFSQLWPEIRYSNVLRGVNRYAAKTYYSTQINNFHSVEFSLDILNPYLIVLAPMGICNIRKLSRPNFYLL